ncbi:MAG: PDDEXK nuclease domain-containing protein, partial [Endomicrobium sp.]|nr:PDDEXK nuclease domain-containing protein [Endomicrobium sp.]
MRKNITLINDKYNELVSQIGVLFGKGRTKAAQGINTVLVETYWSIGKHIVEYEQGGKIKSEYGSELLDKLSKDLTLAYGKGFSRSNLVYIRKLYIIFPISETLSHQLSWGHYFEILKADDKLEIDFYIKACEKEQWSVRELKRQMNSILFHRLALGKDKEGILSLSKKGSQVQTPKDLIKEPYIFEFLGIKEPRPLESKIEEKLIDNLEAFLLELGKGFAFIGRQYRITLSNKHYYVDLV